MHQDRHDYRDRKYLSAVEAARFLETTVEEIHRLGRENHILMHRASSGQQRFDLDSLIHLADSSSPNTISRGTRLNIGKTVQKVICADASHMKDLNDESVHLVVTSPPYFNAKMYSSPSIDGDLGNVHSVEEWLERIALIWKEVFRVLQPGRKAFINIMNLPVRLGGGSYRTLNLAGRTIDLCEEIGFIFKRDIVWHKTNGVRAPIGTYPFPGGILLNNMHEFILELEKPMPEKTSKYSHVTPEDREASRLDKEFWLSIKNSDVWLMNPEGSGDQRDHVAPFPLTLPSRLIRAFSYRQETILDPFCGSGTTLVAASRLGRNGVGYEITPDIASHSIMRLKQENK
ncbi:MAG: site-specific DNA-methyltransferase [Euryarchaeota archaeon]|nr:site-specific DNA-methyltransferase [Euryarchaeota archaeon]